MTFPRTRLRRLRSTPAIRDLVQEVRLHPSDLIQPYFVHDGDGDIPIDSLPGQARLSLSSVCERSRTFYQNGGRAVLLFPVVDPALKDEGGSEAHNPHNLHARAVAAVKAATEAVLALGLKPLMLGGEHSISSGAVAAVAARHPDLVLVQLDAHADLRQEWLGAHHSHACAMRRCLEVLPSQQLLQIAIRSGTREEFSELRSSGRLVAIERMAESLKPLRGKPLYLTVDLDWFDPAVMAGTGTPEPGGFLWRDFAALVEELRHHNLVAADVVELAPILDATGVSSVLAAKVVRSLLFLLDR
jgi:agmatinase